MARKARQRISYVLPLANSAGGHRLGVNGLAVDREQSLLYTGGRDGVICAWDLNTDLQNPQLSLPDSKPSPPPATSFRQEVQAHTHWINDIALAQSNEALVSASSDITVKIWRPAAQDVLPPQTLGLHNDYVKVLAVPNPHSSWVASGGLDRKICLWDLNGHGQTLSINIGEDEAGNTLSRDKGSVYALGTTSSILASGGPESTVRLWDPRTGKRITKFVGHTDNIRDVLISDDGATIMTASSDQTVKVWSVTGGRCMYTFTMHDSSVWSLYSEHPQLSVFYSSDKHGLVAKTDTRGCAELDEGLSVAVCQEHEGVHKLVCAGDNIWTATSRPSINRWKDVDTTDAEMQVPDNYTKGHSHRTSIGTARSRIPSPPPQSPPGTSRGIAGAVAPARTQIPLKHVLRLSNAVYFPTPIPRDSEIAALPGGRKNTMTEITDSDAHIMQPFRSQPEFSIEGQNGLIKHVMLNDRKRVLTLDTAGDVMMWDLLKCVPIKSFGKRHLEDVTPEVNTVESVANWCTVDTRTGSLAVVLEENNCFDAEMYADELDLNEDIEFKEDQRINLGKWVLRYLFSNLITEEIRRDQAYRKYLLNEAQNKRIERENAPTSIQLPQANGWHADTAGPPSTNTVRPTNGAPPAITPGFGIAAATPAPFQSPAISRTSNVPAPLSEEGAPLEKRLSQTSQPRKSVDKDYFSNQPYPQANVTSPGGAETPSEGTDPTTPQPDDSTSTPSKFGKKFRMNMTFGMKKLAKTTTNEKSSTDGGGTKPTAPVSEKDESESDARSSKTSSSTRNIDDNFYGALQKIRFAYDDELAAQLQRQSAADAAGGALGQSKALELQSTITPSLPAETPVLKPPLNTTILIQEDRPEAGGVADLFEGKVGALGEAADLIERVAPMWLAECLLRNQVPAKEVVKISFVLEPWRGELASIAADGNNRLNANRMLRARKILAYVAERIEPASSAPSTADSSSSSSSSKSTSESSLRPEDYLELYCNNQLIPPKMTLATIRAHVWRGGGDVLLYYKANGRKRILHAPGGGEER